jgi:hypothetical protein
MNLGLRALWFWGLGLLRAALVGAASPLLPAHVDAHVGAAPRSSLPRWAPHPCFSQPVWTHSEQEQIRLEEQRKAIQEHAQRTGPRPTTRPQIEVEGFRLYGFRI